MRVAVARPRVEVPGFRFAGVHCGLKGRGRSDLALIVCDAPAAAAGAFTTNRVQAAPVRLGRERLRGGRVQAVVVNSGNANACTGAEGERTARAVTRHAARILGIPEALVVPSSTGRIGVPLPRERVLAGVEAAAGRLRGDGFHAALEAMMTTDAFPKFAVERVRVGGATAVVAGMAKGAGMIAPRMATLLAYVLTDATAQPGVLRRVLRAALPVSLNAIVVDGDTSTNDTVLLLASGATPGARVPAAGPVFRRFAAAVTRVLQTLARMVVRDGEGATKVVDVVVRGARTDGDAARVADAVARSPLCKTAFHGGDPYAGRVLCAAGYSGARFDPGRVDVYLDDVQVVRRGVEQTGAVEAAAAAVVARPEFTVTLELHAGRGRARRVTSDLSVAYVRFNSRYRT